jgi:hypothetical protein
MAIGNPITSQNNYRVNSDAATAGQTLFTVVNGYQVGKLAVYRNGVRLSTTEDYTAADGSTVTLNEGCQAGDLVTFEILNTFSVDDVNTKVGIESAGTIVGNSQNLNFTGTGNTFAVQSDGTIDISISGGARGGGPDKVFVENQRTVTTTYNITQGYSAVSVGPVSVSAGVTVSIPGSERWVIL